MPILTVENVTVHFGTTTVLDHVSFAIEHGHYVGLIGPNGAGKSTLLNVILGLVRPSQGSVEIADGVRIGFVPQDYRLPAHVPLSVREVITMGCYGGTSCMQEKQREVLKLVGLDTSYGTRSFHTLSGGQKQRVIIARALIARPQLLLFDEPLSGVDHATKVRIYELLAMLNRERDITILFVSHEIEHIAAQCDHVLCLDKSLHNGCHPLQFARGNRTPMTCLPYSGERNGDAAFYPVHHHHKNASQ